jgi:hypothetical protein
VLLRLSPNQLEALCARRLGDGFFARAARWYGWGIALSYGLALALAPEEADALLVRALATLSWIVGGILGLAAARDPSDSRDDALLALARQRGFGASELFRARFEATLRNVTRRVGAPGLVVSLVPWFFAEHAGELAHACLRTLGVAVFAPSLGLIVAGLARAAVWAAPGRGRALLLGVVLLPYAAQTLWPGLPSVPSLLGTWLAVLLRGGSA